MPLMRSCTMILMSMLFIVMWSGHSLHAQSVDVQRMRIPVGTYWLSGGGGGDKGKPPNEAIPLNGSGSNGRGERFFSLPAFCIDAGRSAPKEGNSISALAGDISVTQFKGDKAIATRPMNEAIQGPNAWLRLEGVTRDDTGSYRDIGVRPLDEKYNYSIRVAGLTLAGIDKDDVEKAHANWLEQADLRSAGSAFDSLRTILLMGGQDGIQLADDLEKSRQDFEWETFGDDVGGAAFPKDGVDFASVREIFSSLVSTRLGLDASEITTGWVFDWLRLSTDRFPTQSELIALAKDMSSVGFEGRWEYVDPSVSKPILDALRSTDRSKWWMNWSRFAETRKEKASDFDDAVRVLATSRFSEDQLTSGRIDIHIVDTLTCHDFKKDVFDDPDEAVVVDDVEQLTALAKAIGLYRSDKRLIKINTRDDDVCFQWIDGRDVITKIVPRSSLTSELVKTIDGDLWLVDENEDLAEELENVGIEPETKTEMALRLAGGAQREEPVNGGDLFLRAFSRENPAWKGVDISTMDLSTNGDATLIRLPDDSLMMVDTGLGTDIVEKLKGFIKRNYGGKQPRLRLVVTHTDKDHLGGLIKLLEAGILFDEVVIGTSMSDIANPHRVNPIKSAFRTVGYTVTETPSIIHIKSKDHPPLIDIARATVNILGEIEGWRLYLGAQTELSLYHVTRGVLPNDSGFLVKLTNGGRSVLLTDDLSAKSLTLMTSLLPPEVLKAGFLKWPHHLWFPSSNSNARTMLDGFLSIVSPHTVTFSGVGHKSHNQHRYGEICAYLRASISDRVGCYWTRGRSANIGVAL